MSWIPIKKEAKSGKPQSQIESRRTVSDAVRGQVGPERGDGSGDWGRGRALLPGRAESKGFYV